MSFLSDLIDGKQPLPNDAPYFETLGRFIVAYAVAEAQIHRLTRKMSGVKDEKARAIFGGMRIGDVIDGLRQLMRLRKTSKGIVADVESCLLQFGVLGTCRHHLVHRFVNYEGNALKVTNALTAKTLIGIEEEEFSRADLLSMTADAYVISAKLDRVRAPSLKKQDSDWWKKALKEPWRYKPPQRGPRKKVPLVAQVLLDSPPASSPTK